MLLNYFYEPILIELFTAKIYGVTFNFLCSHICSTDHSQANSQNADQTWGKVVLN